MLLPDHQKDRYCKFVFNPDSQAFDRLWIRYADGTYEPVRREGDPDRKWTGTARAWWIETRPAAWLPWENGFGFAWNHALNEEAKPLDWADKPEPEQLAGNTPYFATLETDTRGRITRRTERIDGRRETWRFRYDRQNRLTSCFSRTGWALDWEYDDDNRLNADYDVARTPFMRVLKYDRHGRLAQADHTRYEYDAHGFRAARVSPTGATRYHHLPDGRLTLVETEQGHLVEYRYDPQGRLEMRLLDGDPVAVYRWRDNTLSGFHDGYREWTLHYQSGAHLPHALSVDDATFTLAHDHTGSPKTVTNTSNVVVKATQYTPFGTTLWDSNPALHLPLGFAGALLDPDAHLLRFGHLAYDPDTASWTAPPAAGKLGWDVPKDPVNGEWPGKMGR